MTENVDIGFVGNFKNVVMCGCTILCVHPQSIKAVTGCPSINPVIRRARGEKEPSSAAGDKDKNCGSVSTWCWSVTGTTSMDMKV